MKQYLAALALTVSLAGAAIPGPALAKDCAEEFDEIDAQIQGAKLQADYSGREADHPLVLRMKGGELVDLTGVIVTATPYESWTGDAPVVDKIGGYLVEAKPLIEAGDDQKCLALLEQARAEISGFDRDRTSNAPSSTSTNGD